MSQTRWTEQHGREVVEQWRRSGQSMSAFARQIGIGLQRLRYWRQRVDGKSGRGAKASNDRRMRLGKLVPGVVVGIHAPISVRLGRGVVVEAESAEVVEPRWLAELQLALEQAR